MTLQCSKVLFTFSTLVLWTSKSFGRRPKTLWRPSQIVVEQWHSVCICYSNIYFTLNKDGLILSYNLGHIYLANWQWTWEHFGTSERVIRCAVCTSVVSIHYPDAKRTRTRGLAQVSIWSKQHNSWFSFKCRPHFQPWSSECPNCGVKWKAPSLLTRTGQQSWTFLELPILLLLLLFFLPMHVCWSSWWWCYRSLPHFAPTKQINSNCPSWADIMKSITLFV